MENRVIGQVEKTIGIFGTKKIGKFGYDGPKQRRSQLSEEDIQ
jgi:hypothetical protein